MVNFSQMSLDKEIKLRYRFYKVSEKPIPILIENFKKLKEKLNPDYKIKILDNHIWLSIGVLKREKHSPQLHIELEEMEDGKTAINGLFGPDPVLWTMFMFLHFIVGGIFIIFSLICYSKWRLNQNFNFDISIMIAMIGCWIILYLFARMNRRKGLPQMDELEEILNKEI
jgi:hypothetical protein